MSMRSKSSRPHVEKTTSIFASLLITADVDMHERKAKV